MAIYFFIFSFERTFKTIYETLLPFFHILLTSTNILIERNEMSAILDFCAWICMLRHNRGHAIFLSRQSLIILHSKVYSVCPWKYQDHLKRLKHLPINIRSVTNTFIWLIHVVTSPKLPLMRSKIYLRWLTSPYFK
jgi:hypothetical protein